MTTRNIRTWKAVSVLVVLPMLVLTTLFAAPAPVALAANTGYRSPTANWADTGTGGDNDGFELNPTRAYADGGGVTGYAESRNTCGPSGGCTERHHFYNYDFSIPADAVIQGIEVRADWWLDSTTGTNSLAVDLSWDGGTSWTSPLTDTVMSTSERTMIFGGAGDTWGRTWSPSDFTNANFRVRVNITTDQGNTRDFRLDWIAVQVTYNQPPAVPTNQTPASGAFTALGNPQFIWSAFSDPNPGDTQTNFQVQLRTQGGLYGDPDSQDSGSVASATNTYTPGSWNLGSGTYCWHVRVQDNYNAWSGYSTDTCFTVDRTAPTSAATSPDYDNGGAIAVDWTASDNAGGSGVANVVLWYRLNAGTWTDSGLSQAGGSGTFTFNPPGGTNGTYDFQTIATDVAGNVEAGPAGNGDDSTVYDTTPPTSQATPPAGPINAPPIAIPWTADGAVSGIATNGILLRYNFNGSTYADGPTASGTSGTFDFTPPSGGGTYCFYTIATDNAGNVEAAPGGANGDGCTIFNTPPVAVDDSYRTLKNTPLIAAQGDIAVPGVLDNDSDADASDALTAIQEAGPASGTLVLDADGSFVYTPTLNFTGAVTFTYHANDGTADSNTATVTITVTEFNYAPVAVDDSYSTPEDTPLTVAARGVLANDSDADSDALTAVREAGPASGTLVLDADGSFVYTPTLNFNGVVTFIYHANDGIANSNTATVTVTVTALNDAPIFTSTPVTSATEDAAYTYDVTATDVDNAVTDLTITAPTLPGWLTLTDNGDGTATLTGTPTHTDIGDHPVVLQASDGAATTTQPFIITVSAKGNYYVYLPALFKNYQGNAR